MSGNMPTAILAVENLGKHYHLKSFMQPRRTVKALDGVSFSLNQGETIAVVGESGCGKTTLAKVLLQIETASFGEIRLDDASSQQIPLSQYRRKIQMVFQDPYSSVNPRKKAGAIIEEPLVINTQLSKAERREKVLEIMRKVGLRPEYVEHHPHMFSGGQRQRIGIARALVLRPEILICDEPVSALDISIQAQVINLLIELQDDFRLSYVFITHDLSVVRHLANTVLVMYLGKVMEYGPRAEIFSNPLHPYTQALLVSTPQVRSSSQKRIVLHGELPSPLNPPPGCAFHKRCPIATAHCSVAVPKLRMLAGREVACHNIQA